MPPANPQSTASKVDRVLAILDGGPGVPGLVTDFHLIKQRVEQISIVVQSLSGSIEAAVAKEIKNQVSSIKAAVLTEVLAAVETRLRVSEMERKLHEKEAAAAKEATDAKCASGFGSWPWFRDNLDKVFWGLLSYIVVAVLAYLFAIGK